MHNFERYWCSKSDYHSYWGQSVLCKKIIKKNLKNDVLCKKIFVTDVTPWVVTSVITSFGVNIKWTGRNSTRWVGNFHSILELESSEIHSSTSEISSLHRWSELFTRFFLESRPVTATSNSISRKYSEVALTWRCELVCNSLVNSLSLSLSFCWVMMNSGSYH